MATKRTLKKAETMAAKAAAKEAAIQEKSAKEATPEAVLAMAEAVKEPAAATPAEKKTTAPRKTAAKKTATKAEPFKPEMFLQFMGKEIPTRSILADVKKIWTEEMGNKEEDIKSLKIYLKPEESKAYYVINDDTAGCMDL